MEFKVKFRLTKAESHHHVTTFISPFHVITHCQHNLFFDYATYEPSSRRFVLRLRFYVNDEQFVVWLKSNVVLIDSSRILKRVKKEFGVVVENGFLRLGGFQNMMNVYDWKCLKLEVDEIGFDFGTLYEIECESVDPEEAKHILKH
ncbi:hypothetical protein KIW84_010214 [Lathyrus oleraceus]|uniref:CYTH domain-containing protein n=1 Tax=Pisum sativum TaxID=3888 RepID=A0A9D5B9G3_PEA|nr:hypothetical protein KIW84_010214 [Pisum sativum]